MRVANTIRSYRKREGLKQAALAERLGVSQSTLSRWERGLVTPPPNVLRRVLNLVWTLDGTPCLGFIHGCCLATVTPCWKVKSPYPGTTPLSRPQNKPV